MAVLLALQPLAERPHDLADRVVAALDGRELPSGPVEDPLRLQDRDSA
ncbi:hypothetical protein ACFZCL_32570 [Streptomyces sp. NPDC008159]